MQNLDEINNDIIRNKKRYSMLPQDKVINNDSGKIITSPPKAFSYLPFNIQQKKTLVEIRNPISVKKEKLFVPPIMENSKPIIIKSILDREGLDRAYASGDSKLYKNQDVLYIAGTSDIGDVIDDLRIPLGDIKNSKRYIDAQTFLDKNPDISKIVSHSMGSAVSAELVKNNPQIKNSNYYGSPFISVTNTDKNTFKNINDPISMFDMTASLPTANDMQPTSQFNPLTQHSYSNFNNSINENKDYKTFVYRTTE